MSFVVGICGGSGCGKTTALTELRSHFQPSELTVISQDDYYLPKSEQHLDDNGVVNFDLPQSIDHFRLAKDIRSLKNGVEVKLRSYTFNNPNATASQIVLKPAEVLVVEGLFILHHDHLRTLLNLEVFIHAEEQERLARRITRDAKERAYPEEEVRYQWQHHVQPSFDRYLRPHIDSCDIVIDNSRSEKGLVQLRDAISGLAEQIRKYI